MEEEEMKEMEDAKEGVEMRIELVIEESGGYEGEPTLVEDDKVFEIAEEEREINVDDSPVYRYLSTRANKYHITDFELADRDSAAFPMFE